MQIGELARQAGVSHRTIHYYERIGLLVPAQREPSGHRRYDESSLSRLNRIAALKALGLPLDDIAEVIEAATGDHSTRRAQERAVEMLRGRLAETEARLRALFSLRENLIADIARLDQQAAKTV